MKITVLGATGQIGSQAIPLLTAAGHDVTSASRATGVDAAIGTGLAEALASADAVVDVLNSPTLDDDAALAYFTATSANVTCAAKAAGVGHYVLLSIVGIDTVRGGGYLRGKLVQEKTIAASGIPFTILRATQFHELTEAIVRSMIVDSEVHAPDALIQPIASAEVAAAVAEVAVGNPANGVLDLGGPEPMTFADMARQVLSKQGNDIPVLVDPSATYFGTPVERSSLIPDGDADRGHTTLGEWLDAR